MAQLVDCLPSVHEVSALNPSTEQTRNGGTGAWEVEAGGPLVKSGFWFAEQGRGRWHSVEWPTLKEQSITQIKRTGVPSVCTGSKGLSSLLRCRAITEAIT